MCSFLQALLSSWSSFCLRYWWFFSNFLRVCACKCPHLPITIICFCKINNLSILSVIVNAHPLITIRWPLDYNMQDSQYGDAEKLTGLTINNATTSTVAVWDTDSAPPTTSLLSSQSVDVANSHTPPGNQHWVTLANIKTPWKIMAIFFKMRNALHDAGTQWFSIFHTCLDCILLELAGPLVFH